MLQEINGKAALPAKIKEKEAKPRKKNDELLKGAFEANFYDFLRFVYPDADIVKTLLKYNYGQERISSFLLFLKNFIFIKNEDINREFDQQIQTLTKGKINMGILEII